MIFCGVPNEQEDQYPCIKRRCCIEQPIPSQVVTVAKVFLTSHSIDKIMSCWNRENLAVMLLDLR